jgi:hypothetical protein
VRRSCALTWIAPNISLYKECSEKLARCRHHRNNNSESAYRISHDVIVITRVMLCYCILNRAFCLDDFTSSLIALTTLSRSSFKLCLTRANICSIVSFIESALANIISLLDVYLLSYFYLFIDLSIRTSQLRVKLLKFSF